MKPQNELNALKKEYEELSAKLRELTEEELKHVSGGLTWQQVDIIDENIRKFGRNIITKEQRDLIFEQAMKLNERDYSRWALYYAEEHGFMPAIIGYYPLK